MDPPRNAQLGFSFILQNRIQMIQRKDETFPFSPCKVKSPVSIAAERGLASKSKRRSRKEMGKLILAFKKKIYFSISLII